MGDLLTHLRYILASAALLALGGCGFFRYTVDGVQPPFLIAADGNSRILIWNSFPTGANQPADVILGQPDGNTATAQPTSAGSINAWNVVFDGVHIIAGDANRILIWNSVPTQNFQPADVVVGQPDFLTNNINGGLGATNAQGFNSIYAVSSDGRRLFAADFVNHRVLIWNAIPTTNFQPADVELGQPDMTGNLPNNGGVSAQSLRSPIGVFSDGIRLFVADQSNHRVLIWNTIPTVNRQPADLQLGQASFSVRVPNSGGENLNSLNFPVGVFSDGQHLVVGDNTNCRYLIWNTIPTANRQPADLVVGQTSPTAHTCTVGAQTISTAFVPFVTPRGRLYAPDPTNNRILFWNSLPTTNGQMPDGLLGQPDFGENSANYNGINAASLKTPTAIWTNQDGQGVRRSGGF